MPDRRVDHESRDRIDLIEVRVQRIGRLLLVAIVVLTVSIVVGGIGYTQRTNDIQNERVRNIRTGCADQNLRNHNTIAALDILLAAAARRQPDKRTEIEASRTATVLLINALAPTRDCDHLVKRLAPSAS